MQIYHIFAIIIKFFLMENGEVKNIPISTNSLEEFVKWGVGIYSLVLINTERSFVKLEREIFEHMIINQLEHGIPKDKTEMEILANRLVVSKVTKSSASFFTTLTTMYKKGFIHKCKSEGYAKVDPEFLKGLRSADIFFNIKLEGNAKNILQGNTVDQGV